MPTRSIRTHAEPLEVLERLVGPLAREPRQLGDLVLRDNVSVRSVPGDRTGLNIDASESATRAFGSSSRSRLARPMNCWRRSFIVLMMKRLKPMLSSRSDMKSLRGTNASSVLRSATPSYSRDLFDYRPFTEPRAGADRDERGGAAVPADHGHLAEAVDDARPVVDRLAAVKRWLPFG